jgi:lysozyme family protein
MTRSTYQSALARLLAHEGGYSHHPDDPGGPTNFGITIADYRRYSKADATAADMRAMSVDAAKAIYRRRYWDAQRCDDLPAGVDYAVFDYGVKSGIGRAGKVLRRMLHLPDDTSAVTDGVIAAARDADARGLVTAICDERLRFLKSLETWTVFGKGWARRVDEVKAAALQMAAPPVPQSLTPATPMGSANAGVAVVAAGVGAAAAHGAGLPIGLVVVLAAAAGLVALLIIHNLKGKD